MPAKPVYLFANPNGIADLYPSLFFAVGVVKTCGSFVEVKRPEQAFKLFIRFVRIPLFSAR